MTNTIEVSRLAKHYGRTSALRDLNLTVAAGEFIALFGRNGAGKTTFLKILAGLTRPSSGAFDIHPAGVPKQHYVRGSIGYLSHNTSLYVDLTALENLRFYARLMDMPGDDGFLVQKIEDVGLAGREREPVRNYSRGMQQRLAIAPRARFALWQFMILAWDMRWRTGSLLLKKGQQPLMSPRRH
jgi:heme exporter protein A